MNKHQYETIITIGAKLLGTFGASVQQAQARMKSLESTALAVANSIKRVWATVGLSIAGYFATNLFRKAFEGAFEAAAEAQQRALSLTNEFWIHMRNQGYDAAEAQTKALIAVNQELAKTGVVGRGAFDAMADSLSKIGLAPKEIADMEPILAGLLVRAKGVAGATAEAGEEIATTVTRAAKGGRLLGLLKLMPLGPSERQRIKAYGDDWRGALKYIIYLASTYKDFNVALRNTPLGQIQRMRNSFKALARDIGETVLPAQADLAKAWEDALPRVKPAILFVMQELAELLSRAAKEAEGLMERLSTPDAKKSIDDVNTSIQRLLKEIGLDVPKEGLYGRLFGFGFLAAGKVIQYEIDEITNKVIALKAAFNFLFGDVIKGFKRMSEEINAFGKVLNVIKAWMWEAFHHPIDAAYHRLEDLLALMHLRKKPSAVTEGAYKGTEAPAQEVIRAGEAAKAQGVPAKYASNPALRAAYLHGNAAPKGGPHPNTLPQYAAPPPPAGRAPTPIAPATSHVPAQPAMPTIRIYGQPSAIGGGMGGTTVPAGATQGYYGGGMPSFGGAAPAGVTAPPAGGGGGAPMPDTAAAAKAQAQIQEAAKGGPAGLNKQQQKGAVLYGKLLAEFRAHPPVGVPPDAARFGITKGTPEEWARWGVSVAHAESGFNPRSTNLSDPGGSFGVFQYSHGQAYGNAYDVDNSVKAFVRDVDSAAAGGMIRGSTLAKRFSTIGNHPDVGAAYLGGAERIAQASQAQDQQAQPQTQAPPLLAAVPAYQEGGIAKKPQVAMLAEQGPEMVMPAGVTSALQTLPGSMEAIPDMTDALQKLPAAMPSPLPSPPTAGEGIKIPEFVQELLKHGGAEKLVGLGFQSLAEAGIEVAGADVLGAMFPLLMHPTTLGASTLSRAQQLEAFQSSIGSLSTKSDPESKRLLAQLQSDPEYLRAKAESPDFSLHHAPTIHIHGNADESARKAIQIQLDDAAKKFIQDFKDAQRQERRLSYESGYS